MTTVLRCSDCGFLTMRNMYTGRLDELDSDFRRTGNPPQVRIEDTNAVNRSTGTNTTTPYRHVPICFVQSVDLAGEFPGTKELLERYKDWPAGVMLETIVKERSECQGKHTPWQQGFTPKEHRENLDRENRRQWEANQQQADREWRETQRSEDRTWRLIELAVFGVLAISVGAAVAIVAAFIERGSWP